MRVSERDERGDGFPVVLLEDAAEQAGHEFDV